MENKNRNKVVTYSLLATINNRTSDIKDLSSIFIPLVKRVISQMNEAGYNKGKSLTEIKDKVDQFYSLDMPYPLLRKIIESIAREINTPSEQKFILHNDGSFLIQNYVFADYEEIVFNEEKDIEKIETMYNAYLDTNGIDIKSQPSLFDFIDGNREALSPYFAKKINVFKNTDFSTQAKFVNSMKGIPGMFDILRRIYLGSIITSYLEFELKSDEQLHEIEFAFDTNFIIGLLDLDTIEATHTCRKIMEICKKLKYKLYVLDYTIEETKSLLRRVADNVHTTFLTKRINPESIYNACDRKGYSRTDIDKIANELETILFKEFGIKIVPDTTSIRNEAKFSKEFEMFKGFRYNEWSALHDATAVLYVQKRRGKRIINFYDANSWFVTNTSHALNYLNNQNYVPEIIRAEDLINILWLTHPNVKIQLDNTDVVTIGLSRLISSAINNSLPSAKSIKELDENIQKYGRNKISDNDIIRVGSSIAEQSVKNLDSLNQSAKDSPDDFIKRLQTIAANHKTKEEEKERNIRNVIISIQKNFDKRVNNMEELSKEKESQISEQYKSKEKNLKTSFEGVLSNSINSVALEGKIDKKNLLEGSIASMQNMRLTYEVLAGRLAHFYLFLTVGLPLITFLVLTFIIPIRWEYFDRLSGGLIILYYIFIYFYFVKRNESWTLHGMYENFYKRCLRKYFEKFNFNNELITELNQDLEKINKEINESIKNADK